MKRKLIFATGIFLGIILCFNCKIKSVNNSDTDTDTDKIKNLKKNIREEIPSPDKSKILVLEYKDKIELPIEFSYNVLDAKTKKKLISGVFTGLKLVWANNNSLKANSYEAIMQMDQNTIKSFKIIKVE